MSGRAEEDTPTAGVRIASPFDLEARRGKKRGAQWLGYKVHLTETCDPDAPHLMTHVATRAANEVDGAMTEMIHQALQAHQWLPKEYLVDTAYVSAELLLKSQIGFQVTFIGPGLPDSSWQALEQRGDDLTHFTLDWERQVVTCPQGKESHPWKETADRHGKVVWHALFHVSDCLPCPVRTLCTRSASKRRGITVRTQAEHLALQAARQQQATPAFKKKYAIRAGVEGLISTTAFVLGMRRTRYRGRAKTHFQHLATATALNLKRVAYWLMGIPCITTRTSGFAALAPI